MATNSLAHHEQEIHYQNGAIDSLHECIIKMSALAEVILAGDFTQYKASTMHDYWWTLSELLAKAKILSENVG